MKLIKLWEDWEPEEDWSDDLDSQFASGVGPSRDEQLRNKLEQTPGVRNLVWAEATGVQKDFNTINCNISFELANLPDTITSPHGGYLILSDRRSPSLLFYHILSTDRITLSIEGYYIADDDTRFEVTTKWWDLLMRSDLGETVSADEIIEGLIQRSQGPAVLEIKDGGKEIWISGIRQTFIKY